ISFIQKVLKAPAVAMDAALFCGTFNPVGRAPGNAIRTVVAKLGDLAKGVAGVTIPVVQTAVGAAKTAVCTVPVVNVA
ncbi:hypothetical protein BGZ81_011380, partial [Podila clonocystis]